MRGPGNSVEICETHISVLLFLGERVLKLRKPLLFDFADFSSQTAREEDCRREVALNRRLAPDVYLGVADLTMEGETLDHFVVMRRLPSERSLARVVSSQPESVWADELRRVAQVMADFHARADRSDEISANAATREVARQFEANVVAMARFVGPVIDRRAHDAFVSGVRRFLAGRDRLFARRIADGQVCDGHGDLQADDIYCLDDGPRILDCLEFDDRLRFNDVAADVAFLAMDLERLGHPAVALQFVRDYEQESGAFLPPTLLHLFIALRAYIRTKVACIRYEQGDPVGADDAGRLLNLALAHVERSRVRLVLVGGLPGSGKTALAAKLGDALGAVVLSSDDLRRAGSNSRGNIAVGTFRQGSYSARATNVVYDELIRRAREYLELGTLVVLDASWIDEAHRQLARSLAEEACADLTELHCSVPPPVADERIATRFRQGAGTSEATMEIGRAMARIEAPWPSAAPIDTLRPLDDVLRDALEHIGARLESLK
jgi:aminoglycoside phosphotransferase family enzyme/predicted kinase